MFKAFDFNKDFRKIAKKSIYTQEFDVLHEFLPSDNKNIRYEYSTDKEARAATAALRKYAEQNKQPLIFEQIANYVFAIRKDGEK